MIRELLYILGCENAHHRGLSVRRLLDAFTHLSSFITNIPRHKQVRLFTNILEFWTFLQDS